MCQINILKIIYLLPVILGYMLNGVQTTDTFVPLCKPNITNLNNEAVNLKEYCMEKTCIPKCCGNNEVILQILTNTTCTNVDVFKNSSLPPDYSNLKIYKPDIEAKNIPLTSKNFKKDFVFVHNKALMDENCRSMWNRKKYKSYILENGNFAGDMRKEQGAGWIIRETEMFCVERLVRKWNSTSNEYKSKFVYYLAIEKEKDNNTFTMYFTGVGTLISSFLFLLVLLVYCALPQLRNLSGMLLMAYVVTQFLAFAFRAAYIFIPKHHYRFSKTCGITSPIQYFLILSSILWLNIMSFDIWWTFRGMRLKRAINRQGEVVKFLWYALYAWGVAAVMTISAVLIDKAKWEYFIRPSFDSCFGDDRANLRYLYAPIGILSLVNIFLFLMTVYNMWLIGRILKGFNSSGSNKTNRSRFRLYFKMSLVMGLSWALEAGQSSEDWPDWIVFIVDAYNALVGVPIFLLFICNRKTLIMLCKRFNIKSSFVENSNSRTKSSESRSRLSTTKGSYTKARNTNESDVEMYETEVSTSPKNIIQQPD